MTTDVRELTARILKAAVPEDLFGSLKGSHEEQAAQVTTAFKHMLIVVHPDKHQNSKDLPQMQAAFIRLTSLKNDAELKCRSGTYGDRRPVNPPPPPADPVIVRVKKRKYTIREKLFQGDQCDLYACTYQDPRGPKDGDAWDMLMEDEPTGPEHPAVLKLVMSAAYNDLADNEVRILKHLYPADQKEEKFYRYLPKPIDSFTIRGTSGSQRKAIVFPRHEGYISLAQILRAYPKGIDFRDLVWMFKRALAGIGFAHHEGVVHGAVVPDHILVHPKQHGAKVIDWSYAVMRKDGKERVKAFSPPWQDLYAPEILAKQVPTPSTDIYMLAKCAVALLGGDTTTNKMPISVPTQIRGFIESCLIKSPSRRPDNAWKLHEEFDDLLEKIVGKPRYRPFNTSGI